jgi:hypothetical protein
LAEVRPLVAGPVNVRTIEENWKETIRLVASIRAGTVSASVMLRKLAGFPRQNPVARAARDWADRAHHIHARLVRRSPRMSSRSASNSLYGRRTRLLATPRKSSLSKNGMGRIHDREL